MKTSAFITSLAFLAPTAFAQTAQLKIDPSTIVAPASPMLYGLMTEEINHSYEGGLYAQLLSNQTFRAHWDGVEGWQLVRNGNAHATIAQDKTTGPSDALNTSMKLVVESASASSEAGLSNHGFWGIKAYGREHFNGSLYARIEKDTTLTARLIADKTGTTLAETTVPLRAGDWSRYEFKMQVADGVAESAENHFVLTVDQPATVWLQLVTLFPPTYNDRPNGTRPDLMQKMAWLHPHFLRLPGGNYLEGDTMKDWYDWKKTIGPLVDRPGHQAPWSYWSTDEFGLLEFLEWCEDLHVHPLLAVYAGYSLKGEKVTSDKELAPYVQSALDEVEYVTGDVTTKWGAERAKDGHPAPFPLQYIEIGNEDWLDHSGSYEQRYPPFALALRKKYPQYKLIATMPLKHAPKGAEPDVIDDHFYKSPAEMFDLVHHYDDAPRDSTNGKVPKIFVGEWATRSGSPTPNFGDALGDAAWMTSMERNSDLIVMASYAPLLTNVNPGAMQWATDLIGFDAKTSYRSPSYYAQQMFAANVGDETPKNSLSGAHERFFYSVTEDSVMHTVYLKLVNASTEPQDLHVIIPWLHPKFSNAVHFVGGHFLHAGSFDATNSITNPDAIVPQSINSRYKGNEWNHTVAPLTIEEITFSTR